MNLRENIKRVLREESKKDLTSVMETLLEGFVNDHKDVICKVEVNHPEKRTKLLYSDNNYKNYRIDFYFIGLLRYSFRLAAFIIRTNYFLILRSHHTPLKAFSQRIKRKPFNPVTD
jgi:hypothetical protein